MRKWGVIVAAFYTLIILGLVVPAAVWWSDKGPPDWFGTYRVYRAWPLWILIGIILASQALLLFLTVDTSFRKLKPRAHVVVSCVLTGMLLAVLTGAAILCLGYGSYGNNFPEGFLGGVLSRGWNFAVCLGLFWLVWTIIFYFYVRNSNEAITRATSWLLKGSVLELLIAVPCHIIVRRRHDCSAPVVTSFGIATGIAIMLLSFGPSVLFLYKKRLEDYGQRRPVIQ
jgi:hypothetical protein